MDPRVNDAAFLSEVHCKRKKTFSNKVVYQVRDATVTNNYSNSENLLSQLLKYDEFSEYLPQMYSSQLKYYIATLVNTCSGMAFELALMDLDHECIKLNNQLLQRENAEELKISDESYNDAATIKKAQIDGIKNNRPNNPFKSKQYSKPKEEIAGSKKMMRLRDAEFASVCAPKNRNKIDISSTSVSQIQYKLQKLRSGKCKPEELASIVEELFTPAPRHYITKDIEQVVVDMEGEGVFTMQVKFNIFHHMEYKCATTDDAVKWINQLPESDRKYCLSHDLKAKVLRQRLTYNIALAAPADV